MMHLKILDEKDCASRDSSNCVQDSTQPRFPLAPSPYRTHVSTCKWKRCLLTLRVYGTKMYWYILYARGGLVLARGFLHQQRSKLPPSHSNNYCICQPRWMVIYPKRDLRDLEKIFSPRVKHEQCTSTLSSFSNTELLVSAICLRSFLWLQKPGSSGCRQNCRVTQDKKPAETASADITGNRECSGRRRIQGYYTLSGRHVAVER